VALGEEDPNRDTTSVSVRLIPIFGITIPVIIRVGDSATEVYLSDLALEKGDNEALYLKMSFNRSGNMSVYGDLNVTHVAPNGTETRVGVVNGIAVYTPNTIRNFRIALDNQSGVDFSSGKLLITYTAQSDVRPETYATAQLELP
jgi:hypothetical protein